ncbi:MAG: alpha/beta hydrolase [Chryseosolibacter sp.]
MNNSILARNNVKVTGNGKKPMLFAHGFGCDQTMWRYITPAFENDYQVIVFDYVGSGKSDLAAYHEGRYSTLNGYALDILEICEELNLRDVMFVGHSVSSMTGLLAAIKEPDYFAELILIAPSPRYLNEKGYVGGFDKTDVDRILDNMGKDYEGWANGAAPDVMKNPDRPDLSAELVQSFLSIKPSIARNFMAATFFTDNRKDLLKLKKPSLIVQTEDDRIVPIEVGDYLHAHLENSTLKVLKASGHYPHLSHPRETIRVMKAYLNTKDRQKADIP